MIDPYKIRNLSFYYKKPITSKILGTLLYTYESSLKI